MGYLIGKWNNLFKLGHAEVLVKPLLFYSSFSSNFVNTFLEKFAL